MNESQPESIYHLDVSYPLLEMFYSIQGEGYHSGKAAFFIRLAGCDVRCWWCDVPKSWEVNGYEKISVAEMLDQLRQYSPAFVVITGGEPTLYDLSSLTQGIHRLGYPIHLETSGSSPIRGEFDWITLSPKRFKYPLNQGYECADEIKFVVRTKKDLLWAEEQAKRCKKMVIKYLQPEWNAVENACQLVVNYVKKHPSWRISLQIHKYLNVD